MSFDPELVDSLLQKKLTRNTTLKLKGELVFADCPQCGSGTDRFHVNPYKGSFWCRSCNHQGSVPDLIKELYDTDYRSAFEMLGDPNRQSNNIYSYVDENGKALFEARRTMKGGAKTFIQCLPGGKKGSVKELRKVLYNLPAVVRQDVIYIVEGEKDVETMRLLKYTATCNVGGANAFQKVDRRSLSHLQKKTIYVLPDNDDAGRKHAQLVCEILFQIGVKSVAILDLPDLPEKGDVTDYLEQHGRDATRETIDRLSRQVKKWEPPRNYQTLGEFMTMVESDFTDGLSDIVIPQGVLLHGEALLIAAEYAQMKSMLRLQLALCVASGVDWLCKEFEIKKPRSVGIFQWENSEGLEYKRLFGMMNGLSLDRKAIADRVMFADRNEKFDLTNRGDRDTFLNRCMRMDADVLMFDNLSNMHTANENDNIQMRSVLDYLREVALKTDTSVVLVHHMGKPGQDQKQLKYRIRGASSIQDWASTIMTIAAADGFGDRIVKEIAFPKLRDPDGDFLNRPLFAEFNTDRWSFSKVNKVELYDDHMREVIECMTEEGGFIAGYDSLVKLVREVCEVRQNKAVEIIKALFEAKLITNGQKQKRKKTYIIT